MSENIEIKGDAVVIAQDNLRTLAEGKKIESLMSKLVHINNLKLEVKNKEKAIEEIKREIEEMNKVDPLEFIKVNPGESVNFSSTGGCRYQL